jgi:hypothetical protein
VLDAWAASPVRFREDANAEEDYALGGYRDRVITELAQNAADAAVRGGVPGVLRLTLRHGVLTAANTGAPLDETGVVALSTLRASGKRSGAGDSPGTGSTGTGPGTADSGSSASGPATVGRFGVGFAAAVAVSDTPSIASATGAVRWSREETRAIAAGIPVLAGELASRSEHVPVLRLPFPSSDTPPDGFASQVTLPLRDNDAQTLVGRLLAQTGPALLLALPALASVTIETESGTRSLTATRAGDRVTITDDGSESSWRVTSASGTVTPGLLADRPAEERARPAYSIQWAFSRTPLTSSFAASPPPPGGSAVDAVVHAPTPTDEPLGLPALLLASFPLSPDRRHVAPGPLTGFLVAEAARVYAEFLPVLAAESGSGAESPNRGTGPAAHPDNNVLELVPGPVAEGAIDGQLRRAILDRLQETAFLPAADGPGTLLRPRDALLLDGQRPELPEFLAPVLAGLVAGPPRHQAFRTLGVRRLSLAELADLLATLDRPASWWGGLYEALSGLDAGQRAELGALPVPLADGRVVRGPRGLLLPGAGLAEPGAKLPEITRPGVTEPEVTLADQLAGLGLRIVDPEAAHPLLARLGAVEATPRSVLADPATRAAVANSLDEDDPEPVAEAVLGLVAAADLDPGELPWLAGLALPGEDGDWYAADELLFPGGPLASVVADDAPFGVVDPGFASRWEAATLEAVGVLSTFGLVRAEDVDLGDPDGPDLDVDGADEWADDVRARVLGRNGGEANGGEANGAGGGAGGGGFDGGRGGIAAGMPPVAPELLAIRDLDLVDPDRWPRALELLGQPPLRAALTDPTRVLLGDGRYEDVPSYTAWWLRANVRLDGRRPTDLRTPDADPLLEGLYDPADPSLAAAFADPAIARALGVRTSLADLLADADGADDLLQRLADGSRPVTRTQLRALWTALGAATADVTPPERIRAVRGGEIVVADADDVLVLDVPDLWPLVAAQPVVLAPHDMAYRLAELLDLPLASEEVPGAVESSGQRRPVPSAAADLLPDAPEEYQAHDTLIVDGTEVPWRCADGEVHASGPAGLGHALAWAAGQWPLRHLAAALLTAPDDTAWLLADADLDPS